MLHKSIHLFVRDVPVHTSVHKNLINKRIKDIINVICVTFVEQKHFFYVPKLNFFFIYRCFSTIIYIFASVIHLLRIDVRLQIAGNPLWKSKTNKAVRQRIMNDEKSGEIPELFERTIVTACISIKKEELAGLEGFALTENGRYANE